MKKRILAAVLASASILGAVAGCSSNATSSAGSSTTDSSKTENSSKTEDSSKTDDSSNAGTSDKFTLKEGEGKTLNIAVWNEEFKNYFCGLNNIDLHLDCGFCEFAVKYVNGANYGCFRLINILDCSRWRIY